MGQIAIIHFTNYPKGQNRPCMAAVMRYTMQEKKTLWNDQRLVTGINCRPESVYSDFLNTKLLYHKDGGTMFYHMVQSFPKGEKIDPAAAHAAALKLAKFFDDREVLVCTHVDRDHIHSHFLINSVSLEDGKKLHISEPELTQLRQRNDQVCMEFGLPVFQPQEKKQATSMSGAEYHAAAKGESWKFRLMNTIDECMRYAASREQFISLMRSEGYDVRWTDSRRNITYTTPDGKKCRDDRLHEEKYLKEAMEHEFRIRAKLVAGGIETVEQSTAADGRTTASRATHTAAATGAADPDPVRHAGDDNTPDRISGQAGAAGGDADGTAERADQSADTLSHQGPDGGNAENADANRENARTGWEEERAAFLSATYSPAQTAAASVGWSGGSTRPDVSGSLGADLLHLGRELERNQQSEPVTPPPAHIDKKQRRKEQEKRIAMGHKPDDHEEEITWQQTM